MKYKRIMSFALATSMLLSSFPTSVFAQSELNLNNTITLEEYLENYQDLDNFDEDLDSSNDTDLDNSDEVLDNSNDTDLDSSDEVLDNSNDTDLDSSDEDLDNSNDTDLDNSDDTDLDSNIVDTSTNDTDNSSNFEIVSSGTNQYPNTNLNITVKTLDGQPLNNYSSGILEYVSYSTSADPLDPTVAITILQEAEITISQINDTQYYTPNKIVVAENIIAELTLDNVTFQRINTSNSTATNHYNDAMIDVSNSGAKLYLTLVGENKVKTLSDGSQEPVIAGLGNITIKGDGKLTIHYGKSDETNYASLGENVVLKRLEDSTAFE